MMEDDPMSTSVPNSPMAPNTNETSTNHLTMDDLNDDEEFRIVCSPSVRQRISNIDVRTNFLQSLSSASEVNTSVPTNRFSLNEFPTLADFTGSIGNMNNGGNQQLLATISELKKRIKKLEIDNGELSLKVQQYEWQLYNKEESNDTAQNPSTPNRQTSGNELTSTSTTTAGADKLAAQLAQEKELVEKLKKSIQVQINDLRLREEEIMMLRGQQEQYAHVQEQMENKFQQEYSIQFQRETKNLNNKVKLAERDRDLKAQDNEKLKKKMAQLEQKLRSVSQTTTDKSREKLQLERENKELKKKQQKIDRYTDTIQELTHQNRLMTEELNKLNTERNQMIKQGQQLTNELAQEKLLSQELDGRMGQASNHIQQQQQQLTSQQNQIQSLQQELEQSKKQVSTLEQQKQEGEKMISTLQSELQQLQQSYVHATDKHNSLHTDSLKMVESLRKMDVLCKTKHQEVVTLTEKCQSQTETVNQVSSQLEQSQQQAKQLTSDYNQACKKIQLLEQQLRQSERATEQLNIDLREYVNSNVTLKGQCEEAVSRLSTNQTIIQQNQQQINHLEQMRRHLESELSRARDELQRASSVHAQYHNQLAQLQKQLSHAQADNQTTSSKLEKVKLKLRGNEQTIFNISKERDEIQKELDEYRSQSELLNQYKLSYDKLRTQNEELIVRLSQSAHQQSQSNMISEDNVILLVNDYEQKIAQYTQAYQTAHQTNEKLKKENNSLREDIEDLDARLEELEEERNDLIIDSSANVERIGKMTQQMHQLQNELNQFKLQLKRGQQIQPQPFRNITNTA